MPELGVEPLVRGPHHWTWRDPGLSGGLEKVYSLTGSSIEGLEGYPLLTIRQTVSSRLDSYVTFSILVAGPGPEEIERCLTTSVVNHLGAYSGLRSTTIAIHREGLAAGLAHAMTIGGTGHITEDDISSGRVAEAMRQFAAGQDDGEAN